MLILQESLSGPHSVLDFFVFLGHYRCKSPARIHFTQNSKVPISGHMCYEAGRVPRPLNVSCWGFHSSCSFFKVVNV